MNRREFAAVAGVGVGGFFFPQRSEGVPGLVLEGMSDLEMAQLIAEFPQGPKSSFSPRFRCSGSCIWKLTLRECDLGVSLAGSVVWWWSEDTILQAKDNQQHIYFAKPDTRLLRVVEFYYATDSTKEEDMFTPDLIFRRRNGLWFGIDLR